MQRQWMYHHALMMVQPLSMNLLFVINPKTGLHTPEEMADALCGMVDCHRDSIAEGVHFNTLIPDSPEDLRIKLRAILDQGEVDTVAAVGGDGTVMEILPVLLDYPTVKLGIIPQGTGNLLAANLGISADPETAIRVLLSGVPKLLDIGKIGDVYFALIAGAGIDAEIVSNVDRSRKRAIGIWAYFIEGMVRIFQARRAQLKVTVDGKQFRGRGIGVLVANAGMVMGPNFTLTPDARPDDGLFDVCILRFKTGADYIAGIWKILSGQQNDPKGPIRHITGRRIKIESTPRLKVQADGNPIGITPVEIEMIPDCIRIMVPSENLQPTDMLPDTLTHIRKTLGNVFQLPFSGSSSTP
jgi:diacylglycerol kinase (ATP)